VLIQLFPPDDERLSLETCRGGKINTLKKVKKRVKLVENPQEKISHPCRGNKRRIYQPLA
jgi:hypothetical protein